MKDTKVVAERHQLQANIMRLYAEIVSLAKLELCNHCQNFNNIVCKKDLLPITSRGEQCPYHTPY